MDKQYSMENWKYDVAGMVCLWSNRIYSVLTGPCVKLIKLIVFVLLFNLSEHSRLGPGKSPTRGLDTITRQMASLSSVQIKSLSKGLSNDYGNDEWIDTCGWWQDPLRSFDVSLWVYNTIYSPVRPTKIMHLFLIHHPHGLNTYTFQKKSFFEKCACIDP